MSNLKIARNSRILIHFKKPERILEGKVVDAKGSCVQAEIVVFKFLFIKKTKRVWYSFYSDDYNLLVDKI